MKIVALFWKLSDQLVCYQENPSCGQSMCFSETMFKSLTFSFICHFVLYKAELLQVGIFFLIHLFA